MVRERAKNMRTISRDAAAVVIQRSYRRRVAHRTMLCRKYSLEPYNTLLLPCPPGQLGGGLTTGTHLMCGMVVFVLV